jgi:DNA-binding IclR family transcriptional regulator
MHPQTYSVLEAIGSAEAVSLLLEILERPAGVDDLATRAGLSKSTTSRRLRDLALAGVVSRARPRDPYSLTCDEPTRRLLEAASSLASAILEARGTAEQQFERRVRKSRLSNLEEGEVNRQTH